MQYEKATFEKILVGKIRELAEDMGCNCFFTGCCLSLSLSCSLTPSLCLCLSVSLSLSLVLLFLSFLSFFPFIRFPFFPQPPTEAETWNLSAGSFARFEGGVRFGSEEEHTRACQG